MDTRSYSKPLKKMAGVPHCILYFWGVGNQAEYKKNELRLQHSTKKWRAFRPVCYTFLGVGNPAEYRHNNKNLLSKRKTMAGVPPCILSFWGVGNPAEYRKQKQNSGSKIQNTKKWRAFPAGLRALKTARISWSRTTTKNDERWNRIDPRHGGGSALCAFRIN